MPQELGWRPANDAAGGFEEVDDEHPLPVYIARVPVMARGAPIFPQPFSYPLAGSVAMLVKNAQGFLNSVIATNINAAVRYLQVFNQSTAPAANQVPVLSLPIPAGSATVPGALTLGSDILGVDGFYLTNGIALGVSTAAGLYTAATATDHAVGGMFT